MDPYNNSRQAQDDKYNPAMNRNSSQDLKNAEEQSSNYNDDPDASAENLNNQESASTFKNSFTGSRKGGGWGKKGGIFAGVFGVLITAAIAFVMTQVGLSLPSIAEPIDDRNNTLSQAYERRGPLAVARVLTGNEKLCSTTPGGLRCKTSKVSNKALKSLHKKGIVANFSDGSSYNGKTSKGFPKEAPKSYTFTDSKSTNTKTVNAADIKGFLENSKNSRYTAKIVGKSGALHVRSQVWRGKAIDKLFGSFGIKLNGAKGKGVKGNSAKVYETTRKTHRESLPEVKDLESKTKTAVGKKLDAMGKKLGRGGIAYTGVAAGCMVVKLPSIVAAGVVSVQMARVAPQFTDLILSPASQQKVSGVDKDNAITKDETAAVMTMLTHKTKNDNGEMTSALNSPILLSAMGVNHSKPEINPDVVPGYQILHNPLVVKGQQVNAATEPYCSMILSPMVMYSFATAETSAALVSAGFTGGIAGAGYAALKVAGQIGITIAVQVAGEAAIQAGTQKIIEGIVKGDIIGTAEGEELGDVLGIGAMTLYSSGALTRNLPVLAESQLSDYVAVKSQLDERERNFDVATLSPFDTSSKYTFLGSMTRNLQNFALSNQLYTKKNLYSSLASLTSIPSYILSPASAQATDSGYSKYCGYAKQFGMDSGDPNTTPAMNAAGMPCTGITLEQSTMSIDTAIDRLEQAKLINIAAEYDDDASVEELIGKDKLILPDTVLSEYIETCGHPESGDMIYSASGCMFPGTSAGGDKVKLDINTSEIEKTTDSPIEGDVDTKTLQAIPVFLMDFQNIQMINGFGESEQSAPPANSGSDTDTDSGATIDGDAKELAQKLLDSPNVSFLFNQDRDAADKSRPSDNLKSIAAGELANTSTRGHAGGKKVAIDVNLLKFLVELSSKTKISINALVGQKHSATSKHYKGIAVDLDCGPTANLSAIADPIAKKYGVGRNWENCTPKGNNHWHYEVGR